MNPRSIRARIGVCLRTGRSPRAVAMLCLTAMLLGSSGEASAACGGTTITWGGASNTNWATSGNWSPANIPNATTEDAVIVSATRVPRANSTASIGCLDINSGSLNAPTSAINLTINGDHFRNLSAGGLNVTAGVTFTILMSGTAAQTFENVDAVNYLTIVNNTSVTFTNPFTVRNTLSITGSTTTLNVNADLTLLDAAAAFTIPAGTTVNVGSGATLTAKGGITVNGTLTIDAGGRVLIGNGKTLQVNGGALFQLAGASGNVATLDADASGSYTANIAGSVNASYFQINRPVAAGLNVTGTIQAMDNGEFHYLAASGYAVTLGAASTIPGTMAYLGFFDDASAGGVKNFNATAYTGGGTTVNNWSGLGGAANETDPGGKIAWGSQAATRLSVSNNTPGGIPVTPILQATGPNHFATFAFALTQTDVATDITSVTLTNSGTATAGDMEYVQVFQDTGGGTNCVYDVGVDTQIGSNLTMSGSPPTATVSISGGAVQTSGTTPACIHVLVRTSATATNNNTIAMRIASTSDVTNSTGYNFSDTAGPPVTAGASTISGDPTSVWDGSSSTVWNLAANWTPATIPSSTRDCKIGSGVRTLTMAAGDPNGACQNTTVQTGGTINYTNKATWELAAYGTMTVQSGVTFTSAGSGVLAMRGAGNQGMSIGTTFPGNLLIANTGTSPNNVVSVNANSTVTGTLSVNSGVLRIPSGVNLTVSGNVTIASGATLDVEPGGTLTLGSGVTLTVSSGGTLELIGTASQTATVTSTGTADPYAIVVNGTIKARYYTLSRLGIVSANSGLVVNSGATIDGTYYLLDGSFSYPVSNNTQLLKLYRKIPGNALSNMSFDAAGSSATGVKSIYLDTGIGAPSENLTITTYTGSLGGPTYEDDQSANYSLVWTGASNTLDLTAQAGAPGSLNAGQTYVMGRFAFKQTLAGASYVNTNVTSLKLTMTGTGTANDVSAVRIYYDSNCDSLSGTLLASGTLSGNPATVTFSSLSGATVEADVASPPTRCIYVEYDIAAGAQNANTAGVKIAASGDVTNSQTYGISGSTPPPVPSSASNGSIVGSTTTTWLGTTNTDWFTGSNWSAGIPDATKNCTIASATNNPALNTSASANCGSNIGCCKNLSITNGSLTLGVGATLDIFGNFANTNTFTQSGTLRLAESGTATTQTISSTSTISSLTFNKAIGGGIAKVGGTNLTITTMTLPGGSNFEWQIPNGQTLTLSSGVTVSVGTFNVQQGGTLKIGAGQVITVSGGTFKTTGLNTAYPNQAAADSAKITVDGAGTWGFTATSGTVDLTGFIFDSIDNNGLNIGGTTTLANLNGGQFTALSTSYASMKAIQLNTTGSIPATATNIGWNWGLLNAVPSDPPVSPAPQPSDGYTLVSSTGCASQSISFDQWFGDFFAHELYPDTSTKVSASGCTITIAASASPVSLMALSASGYDGAVSVEWTTGSELDHAGFNVYRSFRPDGGFVQANPTLIRNVSSFTLMHGNYRFVDTDVINGLTYYYYVEDVAINGVRSLHGPVSAVPDAAPGTVPVADAGTNSGASAAGANAGNALAPGSVSAPGQVDLGNGVHILARTRRSLRLEIVPPAASFAASLWNGAYETVSVAGYSSRTEAGKPELVERQFLIEIDPDLASASVTASSVQEGAPATHQLAPAPSWSANGSGVLVPAWSPDAAAYSVNAFGPSVYHELVGVEKIGGRNYVKIRVTPVKFNPVTTQTKAATRISLDLGFDGATWGSGSAPTGAGALSPSAVEGALRIRYKKSGVYQLTFADFVSAGVEGPFAGADLAEFRLFHGGQEIPLEVISVSGYFSSGDAIRFYAHHDRSEEDDESEVVLSRFALAGSPGAVLRVGHLNADPAGGTDSTVSTTARHVVAEADLISMFEGPVGDLVDHLYWKKIMTERGQPPGDAGTLVMPIELPELVQEAHTDVKLKFHVQGARSNSVNSIHHLGVTVNSVPFLLADSVFNATEPTEVEVRIPSEFFLAGPNEIKAQALADKVSAGDWDKIYVNRVEVEYRAGLAAVNGLAEIENPRADRVVTVGGFSSPAAIQAYDVSDFDQIKVLDLPSPTTPDGGASYQVRFLAGSGSEGFHGRRLIVFEAGALPKPTSLVLARGAVVPLRSTAQGADLLMIGPSGLLRAASDLIAARQAQGLRVVAAPVDQVYAEFSNGRKSSAAIRDLFRFARDNWQAPAPKYVLILGDASYDPRNHLGYTGVSDVMPIPLEQGLYGDFGDDNWFVVGEGGSEKPLAAIGRIPANDEARVSAFVSKLLAYEAGTRSPSGEGARKLVFVSDHGVSNEGFEAQATSLAAAAVAADAKLVTSRIDRAAGTDAAATSAILSAFSDGPLALAYLGHGAEDRWSDGPILSNAEADTLANTRLPIVMALNCLNAYFYDADPAFQGLGEKLLLNASGGAVAFWGSTGLTVPSVQVALARGFLSELGQEVAMTYHDVRIGDLILRAKSSLNESRATRDALRNYTFLGDPSMRLPASAFEPAPPGEPPSSESPAAPSAGGSDPAPSAAPVAGAAAPAATPAPAVEPPRTQNNDKGGEKESKGFLSCGTINSSGNSSGKGRGEGPGGGPNAAAVAELLLLVLIVLASRRFALAGTERGRKELFD